MTLKEFANQAGVKVVVCGAGWGGRYGYTTKDYPNSTMCGYKTKGDAYKGWLTDTFGDVTGATILNLIEKTSKNVR